MQEFSSNDDDLSSKFRGDDNGDEAGAAPHRGERRSD
jgi:hypothetical protein